MVLLFISYSMYSFVLVSFGLLGYIEYLFFTYENENKTKENILNRFF